MQFWVGAKNSRTNKLFFVAFASSDVTVKKDVSVDNVFTFEGVSIDATCFCVVTINYGRQKCLIYN